MKPADRARLTTALRDHVAKAAEDLRAKMRSEGAIRERAKKLHSDEQVGEDFDVWTDLLARRAAVLWVLKSVYVRVLEDRGLLSPGRILDVEAQQLFEQLAPNLGETAFLRWVYRDLASAKGGLPELFSPQPAEIAAPSDELSRELLAFWRHRDPDSGAHWSFAEEKFEGELMGDLYQELDPVVKDRFALCQTPDFVREFILDRTLTPAIETFGAEEVRLLDPACGSGHFLIDGLKRLVAATGEKHPEWDRKKLVAHCLERVVGIDLNDYACALARARLVMTAAELAGIGTLAEAAQFHPHVYWADGLEQVEKGKDTRGQQLDLLDPTKNETPRASLSRPEARAALQELLVARYHAVVANPPYILEQDEARKAYHRQRVGRAKRYVSATGKYSLAAPFIERCIQLSCSGGFFGLITSNNFMKRNFGRALVEQVLGQIDLRLVVDTAHAYIPDHGTPTVLLFGTNRRPSKQHVRTVMGKKSEIGTPRDPKDGKVWHGIVEGWTHRDYEDEFVSVADLPRELFAQHPWSLGGAKAIALRTRVEDAAACRLGELCQSIGYSTICGGDMVFVADRATNSRRGLASISVPFVTGQNVRDWKIEGAGEALFPYDGLTGPVLPEDNETIQRAFWRHRSLLSHRTIFGQTPSQKGMQWYEHMYRDVAKLSTELSIAYAFGSTHNHFCLDKGGKLYNVHSPVIKLLSSNEDDHHALLAVLNSSLACFWMKQVFHPKTHAGQRHHPDPSRAVYEFAATGLHAFPVPSLESLRSRAVELSRRVDDCARRRLAAIGPDYLFERIEGSSSAAELSAALVARWLDADRLRERMVALQEEIDWLVYVAVGFAGEDCLVDPAKYDQLTCPRGERPFEQISGRVSTVRAGGKALPLAKAEVPPVGPLPGWTREFWQRRKAAILASSELATLETPLHKRAWRETEQNLPEPEYRSRKNEQDLQDYLAERVEKWAVQHGRPFTVAQVAAALQETPTILRVAEVLEARPDFSLELLVRGLLESGAFPSHRYHTYTESGLRKHAAWAAIWDTQRRADAGEEIEDIPVPPEYSQGSRGKATDYLRTEYWRLRGKLDVPGERFIAFTEVPGRGGIDTLYAWAGWSPLQRLKAILAIDEELEDGGVPLADRIALLDSAWRLLPDVVREDATAASRLKAELQALVGTDGPSKEMLDDWRERFPPPGGRSSRKNGKASKKAKGRKTRSSKKKSEADGAEVQEES